MTHASPEYNCPFCRLVATLSDPAAETTIVLVETRVFAFVPLHYRADIKGNCLIAPRLHYENVFDVPDELGIDFFRVTRRLSRAMQVAFGCEGISTRQHNGPAGDQDVWHYHLHIFPRFQNDGLYGSQISRYTEEERVQLANRLRIALASA